MKRLIVRIYNLLFHFCRYRFKFFNTIYLSMWGNSICVVQFVDDEFCSINHPLKLITLFSHSVLLLKLNSSVTGTTFNELNFNVIFVGKSDFKLYSCILIQFGKSDCHSIIWSSPILLPLLFIFHVVRLENW